MANKVKKNTGFKGRLDILTSTVSICCSGQPFELLSLSISLQILKLFSQSPNSKWTVRPLSSVTCAPKFIQFTGSHQPAQGFYWPEKCN